MPSFPIQSTTGDPIFRAQNNSINSVKRFTRVAADASVKLNNQERIVSPGDDALSFSTSRRIRASISSLKVVSETGQLNVTGLGLAIDALDSIKVQLDKLKQKLVQSQVADDTEVDSIQAEIDLALKQIDSTAANTKLGSRSLLNGNSTISAYHSINAAGQITDFSFLAAGLSLGTTSGIQGIRVNKIGVGAPVRKLDDGRLVLSLNAQILSANKGTKAFVSLVTTAAAAGDFAEFRITGKLGSATLRVASYGAGTAGSLLQLGGTVDTFNKLAQETGVVLTSGAGGMGLSTVGYGADEFIKVELINSNGPGGGQISLGTLNSDASAIGAVHTDFGTASSATINGNLVQLGGEFGTTARYLANGFDIEINFNTRGLTNTTISMTSMRMNVDLGQGVVGILGGSGNSGDVVNYGFGNFTTEQLGRGVALNTVTVASLGSVVFAAANTSLGNQTLGSGAVVDLGSGGRLSLNSGNFQGAFEVVERAINQVITEQTRLGTIQGNFIDSINRAETMIGNLSSADADIIGVDAATEITNLVQSQLGISTATSILSQANAIQANIFSLLRG